MKVLFMTPFVPWPPNRKTHRRIYHFLESAAKEHETVLFSLAPYSEGVEHRPVFEEMCLDTVIHPMVLNQWRPLMRRFFDPMPETVRHWLIAEAVESLRMVLARNSFDLIHAEDIRMAAMLNDMSIDAPVIIDRSLVDYRFHLERFSAIESWKHRLSHAENLAKLRTLERRMLHRHHQIVSSETDRQFLRDTFGKSGNVSVINDGIDPEFFSPMERPSNGFPRLGFAGAMSHEPNCDGFIWFATRIFPTIWNRFPHATITATGFNVNENIRNLGRLIPGVIIRGDVADVRPSYAESDVYVCPVRTESDARGKVVEAMAMGRPVVSTTAAVSGLGCVHGEHLLLADTEAEFIEAVTSLIEREDLRARIAEAGRRHVLDHFTWHSLSNRLKTVHQHCISDHESRATGAA